MALFRTSTHKDSPEQVSLVRQSSVYQGQKSWVERTFLKRECTKFIPSPKDSAKCCCGRLENWHDTVPKQLEVPPGPERWHPYAHTESKPTDAYGTIEFQGAPHPSKAQYVRLSSFDSKPDQVLQLLQKHWGLALPKLLITVHGGILNFDLQPKLKRVFRKGLLKAARTTGAWIITGGTNTGVTRHVGEAISDRTTKTKNKVVAIGLAPWGIVENKEDLVGKDLTVPYHCVSANKSNYAVLNRSHSYFLLVDNGTVGKYGGEVIFRKRLEKYIAQQKISIASGVKGRGVPVICVVLEGGANTIRSVLEYVTDSPPVPVVVCDGSGRAADLLAFTHKYTLEDGTMPESLRDQLILTIQKTFLYNQEQAEKLFIELMLCVKKKELITIFRMGEGAQDIDLAILTALLKGTNASAPDQLSLALTWDRVDIARSHIFVYGQEWPEGSLEQAMMDALINDRVDFVKLLLENGVSMNTFLTIARLEELYNTRQGPSNTLRYLVRDIKKHVPSNYHYTLLDIGLVINHLMDGAFRSTYCRKRFRQKYNAIKRNLHSIAGTVGNMGNLVTMLPVIINTKEAQELFPYPFHDLMIWAVLMKRQQMALSMWQHGEEAMAKSLMAAKLYKAMAIEADQDDLEVDISTELGSYAEEFRKLSLELLEHCYKIDDDYTQQLLTYELKNFSDQTCLSLAVAANHRAFIAHTCCQQLLNEMWMGGLQMRKNSSLKVIMGVLFPPAILWLDFKSREELQLMPQTMEEHLDELESEASDAEVSFSINDEQDMFSDDMNIGSSKESIAKTVLDKPANGNLSRQNSLMTDNSINQEYSHFVLRKKKSSLRLGKKIYEFYNAPITKFWFYTILYVFFLLCFMYTVLVKTYPLPNWQEYFMICYVLTLAFEKFRQVIAAEPARFLMKLRVHYSQLWNVWDSIAIWFFMIGVGLRFHPYTLLSSRVVYTVNIVLWIMRILEILSVNKYLGPYLKIISKLLRDMSYFIIIVTLVLISFGIVRQAIHFQNEEWRWHLVRNVFFYPYWMIYGELFADEIDTCYDPDRHPDGCSYASWVAPLLMTPYLLVANILLVNLLIARFNATFIRNNAHSEAIWKFQRYQLILNYELRPILPPPLIMFSHIFLSLKFIVRRCKGKRDLFDNGLKLFLSPEDTEKLHDFEEESMEDFFRDKEQKFQSSSDERIRVINERVEGMAMRMDDFTQKENTIKLSLQTVDYRLSKLEDLCIHTSEMTQQIRNYIARSSRNVSMSSSGSHCRLESEDETPLAPGEFTFYQDLTVKADTGQGSDRSLSVTEAVRSLPSPLLVHSRRPVKDDFLRKYTDYTVQSSQVSPRHSTERQWSQKVRRSSIPIISLTSETHSPLHQRRHVPDTLTVNVEKANVYSPQGSPSPIPDLLMQQKVTPPTAEVAVSQDSEVDTNGNASLYSTAHLSSSMVMTTSNQSDVPRVEVEQTEVPVAQIPHYEEKEQIHPPTSPEKLFVHSSSIFTYPTSGSYSTSTSVVPILTSFHTAEYTTITDEIDTSCMIDRSPPGSPTSGGAFFPDGFFDPDKQHHQKYNKEAREKEFKKLKNAEETEHRKMEKVIRNRLRQISLDETDSISDIAKLVVTELNMTEEEHNGHFEDDNEELHSSTESVVERVVDKLQKPVDITIGDSSSDIES
ncbi:transient receptor potential cation channel subfamily M member 3 [Mytilus galloprovincialis]|uniref:Transient receptor potential cation channel subfamily M member 3 n=1 Tax=Mytilus galloprovincialis TaxID=29158 RepID=A0A8B6ER27_MYTGA|nr:transient receptor potential cation channel subfamily M member 3 [Mytilus galloprovincialis]